MEMIWFALLLRGLSEIRGKNPKTTGRNSTYNHVLDR